VLAEFNRQAATNYSSADFIKKIVLRHREHPELGINEHALIIAANLAHPWWEGTPDPRVIYGNGAQFERSAHQVVHALSSEALVTADEIDAYGTLWGPGTPYRTLAEARAHAFPIIEGRRIRMQRDRNAES
jgi:hypothetical protein